MVPYIDRHHDGHETNSLSISCWGCPQVVATKWLRSDGVVPLLTCRLSLHPSPRNCIALLFVIRLLVILFLVVPRTSIVVLANTPNSDPLYIEPFLFQLLVLALAAPFLNLHCQVGAKRCVTLLGMLVFPIYLWYFLLFKILLVGFPFIQSIACQEPHVMICHALFPIFRRLIPLFVMPIFFS